MADHFAALSAFVAVVDHGGFAAAARRLGFATSSITRQVDALEARLGVPLLNRSTRRVTLTDAGARYLDDARRILGDLEEADRGVGEAAAAPVGVLRVTAPSAFARRHIAPALPSFLDACPEVVLDLQTTDAMVNLVEERIDLAIRLGPLDSSSLIARSLAPHRRVVCAAPGYIASHGEPLEPTDLERHACLCFDYEMGGTGWHFRRDGLVETVRISGPLRSTASEVLRVAALGGSGLVLLPTWLVGEDIAAGRLSPVLEAWEANPSAREGAISAVYLPNRRGSKKIATFLTHLRGHFGTPPYWEKSRPL